MYCKIARLYSSESKCSRLDRESKKLLNFDKQISLSFFSDKLKYKKIVLCIYCIFYVSEPLETCEVIQAHAHMQNTSIYTKMTVYLKYRPMLKKSNVIKK